jgi:hypothetical protein
MVRRYIRDGSLFRENSAGQTGTIGPHRASGVTPLIICASVPLRYQQCGTGWPVYCTSLIGGCTEIDARMSTTVRTFMAVIAKGALNRLTDCNRLRIQALAVLLRLIEHLVFSLDSADEIFAGRRFSFSSSPVCNPQTAPETAPLARQSSDDRILGCKNRWDCYKRSLDDSPRRDRTLSKE